MFERSLNKMKLQKIGRALMLPVAIFPIAAILMGLGNALELVDNQIVYFIAIILQTTGQAILTNMPIAFAVGIAYGLSNDKSGFSAMNGLFCFLIITTLLSSENIATYEGINAYQVDPAFAQVNNQFFGILSGAIGALTYNYYMKKNIILQYKALWIFFVSAILMVIIALGLYFLWPLIYTLLIKFGTAISSMGPLGAGIYAFVNRLLIPIGMHHAPNSVFWFDVIGINDIGNFWASSGTYGVTGMYQAGFFPIMMFGLPAVAFAMIRTAYPQNKRKVKSFLLSAAFASFFTGVTEPLEFSFMFIAPPLYFLHAIFTGFCAFLTAQFQWIAGFSFSAGFIDYAFSFNMPFSKSPIMLIFLGIGFAGLYYFTFTYIILRYNMHTLGREASDNTVSLTPTFSKADALFAAESLVDACGGWKNIIHLDCCITRIRLYLKDNEEFDFDKIERAGAMEKVHLGDEIQVIYGPQADYIMDMLDELKAKL